MSARIFVADDHDIVREGVKSLLKSRSDWTICGEASNGNEAITGIRASHPDAVVLDISMPGLGGLDVARQLLESKIDTKILLFTMHDSKKLVPAAQQVGARGLVLKSHAARDLVRALEIVLAGGTFFGSTDSEPPKSGMGLPTGMFVLFMRAFGMCPDGMKSLSRDFESSTSACRAGLLCHG